MWRSFVVAFLLFLPVSVVCAELEKGKIYRLDVTTSVIPQVGGAAAVVAKNSTFKVIESIADGYIVRFITIYDFGEVTSGVRRDQQYLIAKSIQGASISEVTKATYSGPVSGPLIVPFKYRLDDSSLAGDATLGYYAGYGFHVPMGQDTRVPVTPFFSAGLSQVSVASGEKTDNKTAITWSAGILIQNWGNLNIGILYGQDRIGDKSWEHEGDGWVSLMVGWKLD